MGFSSMPVSIQGKKGSVFKKLGGGQKRSKIAYTISTFSDKGRRAHNSALRRIFQLCRIFRIVCIPFLISGIKCIEVNRSQWMVVRESFH